MGQKRQDGSVQSANVPAYRNLYKTKIDRDFGLYRCMITKVMFTDDPDNTTFENRQVTYEAVIIGGAKEGQIIQNIKAANEYGGQYNYSERIYRPIDTSDISDKPLSEHVGDIVYVQYIQGYTRAPVIIMAGDQPQDEFTGATSEDGFVDRKQYNGVFTEIDKDGNYTLQRKGGEIDEDTGVFVPDEEGDLASIELKEQQIIQQVSDENSENTISSTMDGKAESITITFKSGMVVSVDGQNDVASIVTKGGASAVIDGKGNSVTLKDNGTGELKISNSKVALGASSAELLQQISDTLQKIITFAENVDATHDHIGNLGYPTSPPETAAQFVQLATDLTTIKGLVDGIKGTL